MLRRKLKMPEVKSFAEAHLKLLACECKNAKLIFDTLVPNGGTKVICLNCGKNTGLHDNPDNAYWSWVNDRQYSTEQLFGKVLEAFDE